MNLSFTLDQADREALNRYVFEYSPIILRLQNKRRNIFCVAFIILAFIVGYFEPGDYLFFRTLIVLYSVLAVVTFFGYKKYALWHSIRTMKKISGEDFSKLVHVEVGINPENISLKTDSLDNTLKWNLITSVENNNDYIYLFVSPMTAIIIPLKKISISAEEILTTIKNYREKPIA